MCEGCLVCLCNARLNSAAAVSALRQISAYGALRQCEESVLAIHVGSGCAGQGCLNAGGSMWQDLCQYRATEGTVYKSCVHLITSVFSCILLCSLHRCKGFEMHVGCDVLCNRLGVWIRVCVCVRLCWDVS